jgi:hypothetical protein
MNVFMNYRNQIGARQIGAKHRWNRLLVCFGVTIAFVASMATEYARAQGSTTVQEQRVTERRTVVDEKGNAIRTEAVIETKVEDITPPTRNMFYASPVRMMWMANIGFMRALSPSFAVGGNIDVPISLNNPAPSGFGVSAEGRFYPGANGLRGFYLAPGFNIHTLTVRSYDYDYSPPGGTSNPPQQTVRLETATPISLAITSGWVLNWGDLTIDLGIGFKGHIVNGLSETPAPTPTNPFPEPAGVGSVGPDVFNGTVPTFRLNLGYSW